MKEMVLNEHKNVLQADELSRAIYSCSMTARKVIAFASTKIQEKMIDISPFWYTGEMRTYVPAAEFKISEMLKALGLSLQGQNYEIVKKAINELRKCEVEIKESDDEFKIWHWFQFIQFSKNKDKIELHFSNEIGWALFNLQESFCSLDLHTIGEFKSFYAFRYYEIANSWKGMKGRNGNKPGSWWFQMTLDEIRTTFKIDPNSYMDKKKEKPRLDNFIRKVIQEPVEELNSICNEFSIEVLRIKRGRNLVAFRFECTAKKPEEKKVIVKSDSKDVRKLKREINEEQDEIEKFKNKFPEDFARALEDVKSQQVFPGFQRVEELDEFEAVKMMKGWGLKV